jgi:hypothetical protein
MKCLKCWKDSKREFCRECKEIKQNSSAMVSQNKKKLVKLLNSKRLTPQWFEKFILYSDNIKKYGRIYMEYQCVKEYKALTNICKIVNILSLLLFLWSWISLFIIWL